MTGVLVMAYGTPASPDDVEQYYTHIRRGRPPSRDQLADLERRYGALGGVSRLAERTAAQVNAIRAAVGEGDGGDNFVVALGQKHAEPFVEDGVRALTDVGVDRIVGLVLAPHYSAFSVGQYHERAAAAAGSTPYAGIESWFELDEYRSFLTAAVRDGLASQPSGSEVVFTAHSLPERMLSGDPYPVQLEAGAAAVAGSLGLDRWSIAWQSAGATPEPWRGPDILEVVADRAAAGSPGLLVCPHGFVSDHLEVAYDLDIEAAGAATEAGLAFARTRVLNDDAEVMGALARLVAATARAGAAHR